MRHIVTKKTIVYSGRRYFLGDALDLSKKDAKTLTSIRAVVKAPLLYAEPKQAEPVELSKPVELSQPEAPEQEPEEAAEPQIENRAMQAEPVELSERTGKPKRPYNRRDLSAEQ
jgi:hypothetical protein